MSDSRRKLGDAGESLAADLLVKNGLTIVDRNWRCSAGEIDIVAQVEAPDFSRGGEMTTWLAIVEVRTRRGQRYGTALQSITQRKARKLNEVAQHYVQSTAWQGPWRIDVVAVQMDDQGKLLSVNHVPHAVSGNI